MVRPRAGKLPNQQSTAKQQRDQTSARGSKVHVAVDTLGHLLILHIMLKIEPDKGERYLWISKKSQHCHSANYIV